MAVTNAERFLLWQEVLYAACNEVADEHTHGVSMKLALAYQGLEVLAVVAEDLLPLHRMGSIGRCTRSTSRIQREGRYKKLVMN